MSNKNEYAFVRLESGRWQKSKVVDKQGDIATMQINKDTQLKYNMSNSETFEKPVVRNQLFTLQALKDAVGPDMFKDISKDKTQMTAEGKVKQYGMRDQLLMGNMQDFNKQYIDKDGVQQVSKRAIFLSGASDVKLNQIYNRASNLKLEDVKYMNQGITKEQFSEMKTRGFAQVAFKGNDDKEFNRHVVYLPEYKNFKVIAPLNERYAQYFAGVKLEKEQIKSINQGKTVTTLDAKGVKKMISYNPQRVWKFNAQDVPNDLNKGKGNDKDKEANKAKASEVIKASKPKAKAKAKAKETDKEVEI